jgi:hypothetical protein
MFRLTALAGAFVAALCLATTAAAQPTFQRNNVMNALAGGWENLGGPTTGQPSCVSRYNRIDCFAADANGALAHKFWNGQTWSAWTSHGGQITSAPECVLFAGQMDCFVRGTDNALWQRSVNGNSWQSLGGIIADEGFASMISCAQRSSGRAADSGGIELRYIDCFVRGTDGALWRRAYDGANWRAWESLGGFITTPPECVSRGLRIDCFARGTDNALWRRAFNGTSWADWESLGGTLTSDVDCTVRNSSRIDCFVRGSDNTLYYRALIGSTWREWRQVGAQTVDGGFDCIATFSGDVRCSAIAGGSMRHTRLSGSTWSAWEDLGGSFAPGPECLSLDSRRVDCFARAQNGGALQHRWWDGSRWQPSLPAQVNAPVASQ